MTEIDSATRSKTMDTVILARGGSKGIPRKNILPFAGKPLIEWTINWCQSSSLIRDVYVSSDDPEILEIAEKCACKLINRPATLAADTASSESAWLHAVETISAKEHLPDAILAPQVTSPLRLPEHLEEAINTFFRDNLDSLFSASLAGDLCIWRMTDESTLIPLNFDPQNRGRRQDRELQFIENGSFYIFSPECLATHKNRFGDSLGYFLMPWWSAWEIDQPEDWEMCEYLMKRHVMEQIQ